jgi:hypothetical protein
MSERSNTSAQPDQSRERRQRLERALLGALPLALTLGLAVGSVASHWSAQDFSLAYYPAVHRFLEGASPYAATHSQVVSGAAFVYPAVSALVLAPFALLRSGLSEHVYMLLCLVLVPLTLRVLAVRDWRVYGVVMLWYPIVIGWQGENISVPLMFLMALAWRYLNRAPVAGLIVALAISMKPFMWPLGLWLLATRRWKAAAWALGSGLALNLLAWGLVGFNEISRYAHMSSEDLNSLWRGGYSVLAFAHHLGLGRASGEVLLLLASGGIAVALLRVGLVGRREREAMALAVVLMLVASPLVWVHYFVLLVVPLALARPRFGVLWVLPVVLWLLPPTPAVAAWQLALAWALIVGCMLGVLRGAPVGRWSADHRPQTKRPASLAAKA